MDRLTGAVGEDPAGAVDLGSTYLGLLPVPPCAEDLDAGRVEVDGSARVAGLASGLDPRRRAL
jgi:hypothetical protein